MPKDNRPTSSSGKSNSESGKEGPPLSPHVVIDDASKHKRSSARSLDTPPAKVPKLPPVPPSSQAKDSSSGDPGSRDAAPVSFSDVQSMINAAFAAAFPPSLIERMKAALPVDNKPGSSRSVAPTAVDTTRGPGSAGTLVCTVSTGQGHADPQLARAEVGPTVQVLNAPRQFTGRAVSLLNQPSIISTRPPSGQARPGISQGTPVSSLESGALGIEHSASLPATVVIAADTASLPVSAGAQQLPVAGQTLVGSRGPPQESLPVGAIIDMTELPGPAPSGSYTATSGSAQSATFSHASSASAAGMPTTPSAAPTSGGLLLDDTDSVSQLGDTVCGSEVDGPQEVDPSTRPFREMLEIVEAFLPQAVLKEETAESVTSLFSTLMDSGSAHSARLKAKQSLLVTTAVQAALAQYRGAASVLTAGTDLPSFPSGLKPGKFVRPKPPAFLKEGVAEGEVPRAPPPLSPADLAFTSSSPGPNLNSIPLSHVLATEQTLLSTLDLATLADCAASSAASAIFEPGTTNFKEGTESIQVWRLFQFMATVQKASARLLASLFVSSLLMRRDQVLAAAPGLSQDILTSLRLAPVANNSLFGPAAQSAALRSSQENQQRAFQAVVNLASNQSSRSKSGGARQSRGRGTSATQAPSNSDSRSQQRGRGIPRRGGRGRGARQGKPAAAAKSAAAAQPSPQ